ncbi:MAG: GldM family protein [Crocinitomicaceae bacterium]
MAGGKETPRQKMIGMMYLVLTALLALNVSKSILDAFVAIEENIQKANIVQVDRGDGFYKDVKDEIVAAKGPDNAAKKKKLQYVLGQMDKIDKETIDMIEFIDKLKLEILSTAGENTAAYKDKDHTNILWKKSVQAKPSRMWLAAVQGMDKYDEPMHVLGIAEDIKNPTGNGMELWKKLNNYRSKIVELAGTYQMPGSQQKFRITPKAINEYENNAALTKAVTSMVEGSKANLKEDKQVLIDLYIGLTKLEKNEVHDMEGVHWIGMTFDHSPLVAGIAALSSLQQDILSARALAMAHYKSKVSTGEYSFNKIVPLAYGPVVANGGDDIELRVMMAAFDSDNQPKVTVNAGGEVTYPGNGTGVVKVKAGGSTMELSGTVSIKNKSGVPKTEPWAHTVIIMKPQGSIELPEMNMLYRGYPNIAEATASGYDKSILSGTGVSISGSGPYIVKPTGSGRTAYLSVSGKNTATGQTVQLKKVEYRVSNLPDPEIYWGGSKNGERASKAETKLFAKYGPEIPLKADFTIKSWECAVPGASRPITGTGSNIAAASGLLRAAPAGSMVSFICKVVGPDGITRTRAGAFKI